MKAMKKELKAVIKGLKMLVQKTEKIERELEKAPAGKVIASARGRAAARAKATALRRRPTTRGRGMTATDMVYGIIKKGRTGVKTAQIKRKTGFDDKKIWNVINRLKTLRKIKSARRGVYVTR